MRKTVLLILLFVCLLAVSCGESAEGTNDTGVPGVETASPDATEEATGALTEEATEPPETEAPETEAPETEAPETKPPETEPPATEAPETEAPETEPPATEQYEPVLPPPPDYNTTVAGVSICSPGQIEVTDPVYVEMSSDPYTLRVILTTTSHISNFEVLRLEPDWTTDTNVLKISVFQTVPEFTPDMQLVIGYFQAEYFPSAGVRFTDAGGTTHLLEFAVSGRDSTVFFIEH